MKVILFLIRKEFLQIFRNKAILPIIFVMPIVQLLILSYAADFEIKNLNVYWVDNDKSSSSRLLFNKLDASSYFQISGVTDNLSAAELDMDFRKADLIIHVPVGFESRLIREGGGDIQLLVDAIDGVKAGLGASYANRVAQEFASELRERYGNRIGQRPIQFNTIGTTYSFWFNPFLNYKVFMVPGILVMLVTLIGAFVSAMNIVREKEMGTIEQLNVTPIRKYQFILGKKIPLWLLGLFIFTVGLTFARLYFKIPIVGSLGVIYLFTMVYLLLVLGLGTFISTITETQQQAMFISWFFLVIFILMSGVFTPIENMPDWAQTITLFNPIRYFIEVIRLVMLKGAAAADVGKQFLIISVYAFGINALAVWRYRKTV